ncbi:putative Sensory transduction histidine kinase [Magnetospirillum sp. LM-5]|uniref:sensor histidine kinase n=1 Tax=Magnetospirillum sp. LM-5 TaxID=2681466 RepID=UPI001382D33C|nr:PAS domain S-box protein [Magnetospirillum sp. LM-5]CAA7621250.1 putative Sensory transduction histidine kinase [Magnetospirillum sp. LM-5]
MDFALQAALLGAVMGSAVLAVSTIYGWTLPGAPKAFGWWAGAFILEAASKAVLLGGGDSFMIEASDFFHGMATGLSLCGALSFMGRPITPTILGVGLLLAGGWAVVVHAFREAAGLSGLPLFGVGGLPMLVGAWAFLDRGQPVDRRQPNLLASISFAASGIHQLSAPLLHAHPTSATLSFVVSQFLSMVMAVALLLVVLRSQQARAESEGQRASLLQSRLLDALDGVQDGIALFDSSGTLVTSNDLYREFLAPAANAIRQGQNIHDILKAEAEFCLVSDSVGIEDGREVQLWDGRWVAANVYGTADGGQLRILRDVTARKQTDLALQESVNWLRGIMDTVVDGIITIDDTATVLSYNQAAARIFGYNPDEVVGRNVSMLMPEPYRAEHDGYMARYRRTGEARVIGIGREVHGQRKDGSSFPLELSVTEMRQGELVTFIGLVRDITDRKQVENALVQSEQRFRDLAESASDWFWELDGQLTFSFVSGRVRQVLGVGPAHFIGRSFLELGDAAENPVDWHAQLGLIQARRPFRGFVFLNRMPSGAIKFVEMAGRPVFDADNSFAGYRGTASDVTPLKRHEQELAAQSSLRQAIIDNMAQGVAVFDGTERLVALNKHARLMLDLAEGDVDPGQSNLEGMLLHLAVQGEFGRGNAMRKAGNRLARLREQPNLVFEHARPMGAVIEVRASGMPGGGLILTFTDITDRKKVEDTLREAKNAAERGNRAKATFLANISHELRTPLNAIIGFSELMKHEIFGPLEPVSYRTYVDDIHESGMHLLELINDILDMSKAEAGMTDLVDSLVDVTSVMRSSIRMMARRAQANGVDLIEDYPADLPFLRGDERRVRQIVLNLLSNAVKFTEEGGSVTLSAVADEQGYCIRVADTGIGMSPEDLERVMEPFVQADTRLSRKYEGTGLGLPLTRALTMAHGGTLVILSEPDKGTTATACFPASRIVNNPAEAIAIEESLRRG